MAILRRLWAYTDNVIGDRKFVEERWPSAENVTPRLLSDLGPALENEFDHLDDLVLPEDVEIICKNSFADVSNAMDLLLLEVDSDADTVKVVGFDWEWIYNPITHQSNKKVDTF